MNNLWDTRDAKWYLGIYTVFILFLISLCNVRAADRDYDPLAVPEVGNIEVINLTVHDSLRKRVISLRIYLPNEKKMAPVVLFSHGLGGSCEGNAFMGRHWAARGYVAVV